MVTAALTAAADATSTTAVPRIVGEPLPEWVVVASGVALLVVIVLAGLWVKARTAPDERAGHS